MDLTAAYMAAAIVNKQQDSKPTVGKQDKTNPKGEVFNNYQSNTATGDYSHAEGTKTRAPGNNSHAEGEITEALGYDSHAEGYCTQAKGSCSHAEGYNTSALGGNSHAEGDYATASGPRSHAEGRYTIAASDCQHVQGKYNVRDSEGKYAFIIGNGVSPADRSNAFAVDWQGKIYINNSSVGIDLNDLLARVAALENK